MSRQIWGCPSKVGRCHQIQWIEGKASPKYCITKDGRALLIKQCLVQNVNCAESEKPGFRSDLSIIRTNGFCSIKSNWELIKMVTTDYVWNNFLPGCYMPKRLCLNQELANITKLNFFDWPSHWITIEKPPLNLSNPKCHCKNLIIADSESGGNHLWRFFPERNPDAAWLRNQLQKAGLHSKL